MEKDNIYAGTEVNQTCENCMYKGVCKYQEIFENICKNENLFGEVVVYLGENRYGRLTNLDFIELHKSTCKHFLPKISQEFGNFGQFYKNLWPLLIFRN